VLEKQSRADNALGGESIEQKEDKILIIGHRGGAGLMPENTLAAFRHALEIGLTAIEFDVHLSKDDEIVVYHDQNIKPEITRDQNGQWLEGSQPTLHSLTLEQIQEYKLGRLKPGTQYAQAHPVLNPQENEKIPTLRDVLALLKEMGKEETRLWIEIKTSPLEPSRSRKPEEIADAVLQLIDEYKIADQVTLLAFDWTVLRHVQKKRSDIQTSFLTEQSDVDNTLSADENGNYPWTADLKMHEFSSPAQAIASVGGNIWDAYYKNITLEDVQEAHGLGLKVIVWTPNTEQEMAKLIEMGVDGITTDRPDILQNLLAKKKKT